jgi:4-azaleucine resistance transporter AzlC
MGGQEHSDLRAGIRRGLPVAAATFVLGISFGVLAQPVMGSIAPIVMSILVFSGAAQFAALSVLAAGAGPLAAILAGLLMNARFLPMGLAAAPAFAGPGWLRALRGQAVVDASWAMASRGDGTFDRGVMVGATLVQGVAWVTGTVVGVLGGGALAHPERFGLDAIFPAFYLALLAEEARGGKVVAAALAGAAIALALLPVAPPGLPIIAAATAALLGLRGR